MTQPVEVLLIEDSEEDAYLLFRELSRHFHEINHLRVDTLEDLNNALTRHWDIILCDFRLAEFDGLTALHLIRTKAIDTPFILVSGVVEEGIAANMMRLGANDYIMKDNLKRLAPAIFRELEEARLKNELKAGSSKGQEAKPATSEIEINPQEQGAEIKPRAGDAKHSELLDFIEANRQQTGKGTFIKERHKAVLNILYLANLIKKYQDRVLERQNLTEQQFNVLRILMRIHPHAATINQVKEEILNKTSDVSRIIDRMAKVGLVSNTKNRADKRVRDVTITAKGIAVLDEMNKCAEEMFLPEEYLSENDAMAINEKLKKVLDVMEEVVN